MTDTGVTRLWQDYEYSRAYQANLGLTKNLPMFVRFYEGRQWAAPTEKTKNLPRPVINIIKMICRNKKSAILSTPVRIVYRSDDPDADTEKFNRFSEYIQKELGQEALDKRAVDDGVKKGSYFIHYFWDSEARGKNGVREGALRGEIIDPLNIHFANPRQTDEQKQKWIIIASREDVDSVRAKCDTDVNPDEIVSDSDDNKYGITEKDGDKLCTVLTRYFRMNGEVYCEKATRSTVVNKPFPISPDIEAAKREFGIDGENSRKMDAPNNALPDDAGDKSIIPHAAKAYLYPIVAGNYEKREESIYGLGEVEGLIPNQKSINFFLGMVLLNAQENAWGKYVVLPNALGGQTIRNEPGQVLVDYSNTGSGIRKMTEQSMQSMPLQVVDVITSLTRTVTGASEVMTGETMGSNMSGAAIAQLQSQALLPVEELKESFRLVKEKQGKVLAQFYKLFYKDKDFSYEREDAVRDENGAPVIENGVAQTQTVTVSDVFDGDAYKDVEFEVVVETMSGTKASAAGDINALDVLLAQNRISLKTYINSYPKDALSNKEEILKGIEQDENGQLAQLAAQNAELSAQLEALMSENARYVEAVSRVEALIKENEQLRVFIARLYGEAKEKIALGNARIAEAAGDATAFAKDIADTIGLQPNGQ